MKLKMPTGVELDGSVEELALFYQITKDDKSENLTPSKSCLQNLSRCYVEIKAQNGEVIRNTGFRGLNIGTQQYKNITDFIDKNFPGLTAYEKRFIRQRIQQRDLLKYAAISKSSQELGEHLIKRINDIINKESQI